MTTMTTEPKTKYTTPGNHNLHIPSQVEFQRNANNKLSIGDFDTSYPSGLQIEKVANSLRWTYKNTSNLNFADWSKSYK